MVPPLMRPVARILFVAATLAIAPLARANDASRAASLVTPHGSVPRQWLTEARILGHAPAPVLSHAPAPILGHAPPPMLGGEPTSRRSPRLHAAENIDPTRYDALIREIAARHG